MGYLYAVGLSVGFNLRYLPPEPVTVYLPFAADADIGIGTFVAGHGLSPPLIG
jgi:hypothetical protein